jgi:hypothetical protein
MLHRRVNPRVGAASGRESRGYDGQSETERPNHSASLGDSATSSTRIGFFGTHTHGPGGADHSAGDLAAVGDQERAKTPGGVSSDPSSHPKQAELRRLDPRIRCRR